MNIPGPPYSNTKLNILCEGISKNTLVHFYGQDNPGEKIIALAPTLVKATEQLRTWAINTTRDRLWALMKSDVPLPGKNADWLIVDEPKKAR